jgi:hypothetical protein
MTGRLAMVRFTVSQHANVLPTETPERAITHQLVTAGRQRFEAGSFQHLLLLALGCRIKSLEICRIYVARDEPAICVRQRTSRAERCACLVVLCLELSRSG